MPDQEKALEEFEETLAKDKLTAMIASGECNDPQTIERIEMVFQTNPQLLVSLEIEKVVGLRLQELIVHALAKDHKQEIVFLSNLFTRIQEARHQASS